MKNAATSRRRFQIGLSDLFWLLLVIALVIAALREHNSSIRLQAECNVLKRQAEVAEAVQHRVEAELRNAQDESKRAQGISKVLEKHLDGLQKQLNNSSPQAVP